ncbi:MAG: LPS export ABC transporter periplasmic protein LptC [Solibacterales bacterium]|nr:LPS export ABC transporter periplasmic protein LptC [Bryobacterales bacterium]|tara:strand:- start:16726 stop:19053 length:2328 start_codon:yes stop_codon:yes gene_type:complete
MKKVRLLLLLSVGLVLAVVAYDFWSSRRPTTEEHIRNLKVIPSELVSQASRWHWSQSSAEREKIEIFADSFRQSTKTHLFELEGVELRLFNKNGKHYDQVISNAARFDSQTETLYSEGEVTLSLGLELTPRQPKSTTKIYSSGVTLEARTGVCTTDRPTTYEFNGGSGRSVGAFYDSANGYLRMNSNVYLRRDPLALGSPPIEIFAQELHYREPAQLVDLIGNVRLKEGNREANATDANIYLQHGRVHRVELTQPQGLEQQAERVVHLKAAQATLWYTPGKLLEKVVARNSTRLSSIDNESTVNAWGESLELLYDTLQKEGESVLSKVDMRENAGIETISTPATETDKRITVGNSMKTVQDDHNQRVHRVQSEWIHLTMRSRKQEIEFIETLAPGTLEMTANTTGQWQRRMTARRMRMHYGSKNHMETLLALGDVKVISTASQIRESPDLQEDEPLLSWSQNLEVKFSDSGEATKIKQWEDFRFRKATREGSAAQADFDMELGQIQLSDQARVWDRTSSVHADTILLEEGTERLEAHGNVSSTHQRNVKINQETSQGFFTSTDPILATSENFLSEKGILHYEGLARLWQRENRVEAHNIIIDQNAKQLNARGNVRTTIRPGDTETNDITSEPSLIQVNAESLSYDEETGKATYQKQAELIRDNLTVLSDEIEGVLDGTVSGALELQIAFARGGVRIVRTSGMNKNERQGFGTTAQYNPTENWIELTGLPARLRSEDGRETRGDRLVYHLDQDRILVDGKGHQRTYSYRPKSRQTP